MQPIVVGVPSYPNTYLLTQLGSHALPRPGSWLGGKSIKFVILSAFTFSLSLPLPLSVTPKVYVW